jgi:hypothetical protein
MMKEKVELTEIAGYSSNWSSKASIRQNYPQISKQIATSNHFASLRYLQESAVRHHGNDLVTSKISEGKERKLLMTARPKITGDSHVRGYAERISDNLGHSLNITVYVKPNGDLVTITITAK